MTLRFLILFVGILCLGAPTAAQGIESRYTATDDSACEVVETGEPLGQDWMLHRCEGSGGIDAWLLYQDSARLQVAFGPQDFEDYRPWSHLRDQDWPIEWRSLRGASPFAAIIRMTPLTGEERPAPSVLAVFRIWSGQPDCYLGSVTTNRAARRMADGARRLAACPVQ